MTIERMGCGVESLLVLGVARSLPMFAALDREHLSGTCFYAATGVVGVASSSPDVGRVVHDYNGLRGALDDGVRFRVPMGQIAHSARSRRRRGDPDAWLYP